MLHALIVFAAEAGEEHSDHTAFYVLGSLLALWAVGISIVGIRRPGTFPARAGARTGIVAVSLLLVLGATASAVLTA